MKFAITKGDQIPFTQVANIVLNDKKMSFRAKGLFAYLYSKPEDYKFSFERIANDSTDGNKSVLAAIHELEEHGYLQRKKQQTGRTDYIIDWQKGQEPTAEIGKLPKSLVAQNGSISNIDNTSNIEKNTIAAESGETVFDLKAEIAKMEESPRRDINIIAFFIEKKRIKIQNKAQLSVTIKRYLRAAKDLSAFTDDQLVIAANKAEKEYPDLWTAETLVKLLTK